MWTSLVGHFSLYVFNVLCNGICLTEEHQGQLLATLRPNRYHLVIPELQEWLSPGELYSTEESLISSLRPCVPF